MLLGSRPTRVTAHHSRTPPPSTRQARPQHSGPGDDPPGCPALHHPPSPSRPGHSSGVAHFTTRALSSEVTSSCQLSRSPVQRLQLSGKPSSVYERGGPGSEELLCASVSLDETWDGNSLQAWGHQVGGVGKCWWAHPGATHCHSRGGEEPDLQGAHESQSSRSP